MREDRMHRLTLITTAATTAGGRGSAYADGLLRSEFDWRESGVDRLLDLQRAGTLQDILVDFFNDSQGGASPAPALSRVQPESEPARPR
jgi:hypothetical protein